MPIIRRPRSSLLLFLHETDELLGQEVYISGEPRADIVVLFIFDDEPTPHV